MGNIITVNSLDALANHGIKKISVAFGVFDGVHLGHRLLIERLIAMTVKTGADPVVITFFPHPREILSPEEPPLLLISRSKKIELLGELGVKAVVTLPFTREFADLSAETFLDDCLYAPGVDITGICVGSDWHFGKNGEGSIETIKRYAEVHDFEFDPVSEVVVNGVIVSSTAIRRAVSNGLLSEAKMMLGRHYSLAGKIISGTAIGTSLLECPTANISISHGIIPPNGVYAGYAVCDGIKHTAAISVGTSPTFSEKHRTSSDIEVHLLDFKGNIYGRELETEFVEYIREERCYASGDALKRQVTDDIRQVRLYMNEKSKNKEMEKIYELTYVPEEFTPDTSAGNYRFIVLIFMLILGTVAVFAVMRFMQLISINDQKPGSFQNPLLADDDDKGDNESDTPDLSGGRVYDARKDVSELELDSPQRREEFQNALKQMDKNKGEAAESEMMRSKDSFAAEKLEQLRKIENTGTKKGDNE